MLVDWPPNSLVLVAVVTNQRDLGRALHQGWYRIPLAHTPYPLAADLLALYQTGACGPRGGYIRHAAPISGWRICRRKELLPEEPEHPRAELRYYRLALGAAEELARPVPGGRLRRITFIPTTLGRLLSATSARDLWLGREALACLCEALQREGFSPADRRLREDTTAPSRPATHSGTAWRRPCWLCPGYAGTSRSACLLRADEGSQAAARTGQGLDDGAGA